MIPQYEPRNYAVGCGGDCANCGEPRDRHTTPAERCPVCHGCGDVVANPESSRLMNVCTDCAAQAGGEP
jgi:hypothetical protein